MIGPLRLLYVGDDPADRQLTRRHLERHASHVEVTEAATLADAIHRLTGGDVDLVLSDVRLPDGTGLDLLERIETRGFNVPVVLVTLSRDADAAVGLLKAGAADYVVKNPGYLQTLVPILDGAFRWFQAARAVRQRIRVLYAEHDPGDIDLTQRAFRRYGRHLHLEVVANGREVMQRLRTSPPYDLLLLDYRLPDATGIEVLKALRSERIALPVVMVTDEEDEETAIQALKLGAADYVIKREGYVTKLPSTVENVLAHRRLADEKDALQVLDGLSRSLAATHDLDELVGLLAQAAARLLKAEVAILWLAEADELRPAGWLGLPEPTARGLRLPVERRQRDEAVTHRRMDLTALVASAGLPSGAWLEGAGATLATSLVIGGALGGMLSVVTEQAREFGPLDERLLTVLADHAAIAIENARLYQQLTARLDQLQQTQARLLQTEKIATMGQLLAGVAHELNNPLSVLVGHTTLLRHAAAAGPVADRAQKIAGAAERCARIVKNFLALARHRPPEHQRVHLNMVVREALELLAYALRVDDVNVELGLTDGLPMLWADEHQLHQVLVNLITNAHHAMLQAPAPRRLTLTTRLDAAQARVCLEVADTGPGIAPEIVGRIFEPFFTTKPPGQGTGLGLSICREIIESHGGSLDVENEPGRGATFRVSLPATTPAGAPPEAGHQDTPSSPPRAKSILVVEDEPEVAAVLAELLKADGHEVEIASNGATAFAQIMARTYDVILSDVRMPQLDGPGLYHELQRHRPELCSRVVFATGDGLSASTRDFLERVGARTLTKPFKLEEVRRVIQQGVV